MPSSIDIWALYKESDIHFLSKYRLIWEKSLPFQGLNILNNTPLSFQTLLKVDCLKAGGANVTITPHGHIRLPNEGEVIALALQMGIPILQTHNDVRKKHLQKPFDYILDTGAEFSDLIPKKGTIELTGTGTQIYRKLSKVLFPIISVDDSRIKQLETFFGTSYGFIEGLKKFNCSIKERTFLIFGYGKVGSGLAARLSRQEESHVVIVDICPEACQKAEKQGFQTIHFNQQANVQKAIQISDVIITATGIKHNMSQYFKEQDFDGKILTNIGAEDEYGPAFSEDRILGGKQPLNFLADESTPLRYLDPSLAIHNAAILLIENGSAVKGYQGLPRDIDEEYIREWEQIHNETVMF